MERAKRIEIIEGLPADSDKLVDSEKSPNVGFYDELVGEDSLKDKDDVRFSQLVLDRGKKVFPITDNGTRAILLVKNIIIKEKKMSKAKKIKLIEGLPSDWYSVIADKGCEFEVKSEDENWYYIIVGGIRFGIYKEHAKVIEWVEVSYSERQSEWVKGNDIKVGDKVWFAYSYEGYQEGFNYDSVAEYSCRVNNAYTIEAIADDHIKIEGIGYPLPYFAFEPVTDEHKKEK